MSFFYPRQYFRSFLSTLDQETSSLLPALKTVVPTLKKQNTSAIASLTFLLYTGLKIACKPFELKITQVSIKSSDKRLEKAPPFQRLSLLLRWILPTMLPHHLITISNLFEECTELFYRLQTAPSKRSQIFESINGALTLTSFALKIIHSTSEKLAYKKLLLVHTTVQYLFNQWRIYQTPQEIKHYMPSSVDDSSRHTSKKGHRSTSTTLSVHSPLPQDVPLPNRATCIVAAYHSQAKWDFESKLSRLLHKNPYSKNTNLSPTTAATRQKKGISQAWDFVSSFSTTKKEPYLKKGYAYAVDHVNAQESAFKSLSEISFMIFFASISYLIPGLRTHFPKMHHFVEKLVYS